MNTIRHAVLLLAATLSAAASSPLHADNATVGNGTPASCTEAALNAAIVQVVQGVQAPGGVLSFACGAAPHTIALTSQKFLSGGVTIDGGGRITLDGQNVTRHFTVASQQPEDQTEVLLRDIVLIGGNSGDDFGGSVIVGDFARLDLLRTTILGSYSALTGGAIATLANTTLNINASRFNGNRAQAGGAIVSNAVTVIVDSVFDFNFAVPIAGSGIDGEGGAIQSYAANLRVERCLFDTNTAVYGGAIYKRDAQLAVYDSRFANNRADIFGGALAIRPLALPAVIAGSRFENNSAAYGGAIQSNEGLLVDRSLFRANRSFDGGAINLYAARASLLSRSSFVDNVGRDGGGAISAAANRPTPTSVVRLTLGQVTTSNNRAENGASGGDLYLPSGIEGGLDVSIYDSTLMNASAASGASLYVGKEHVVRVDSNLIWAANGVACTVDTGGQLQSVGHNLAPAICGFGATQDLVMSSFAAFGLGALGDNGGGLRTFLPLPGSPAIDRRVGCSAAEDGDARRMPRPADGDGNGSLDCDAGAVERQPLEVADDRLFANDFESP